MWLRVIEGSRLAREIAKVPAVGLGLGLLVVLWGGVLLLIDSERTANRRAIAADTANLSRVFEQNVIRSLSEIDKTLLYLRQAHDHNPAADWSKLIKQSFTSSEITFQIAVIDARGKLIASDRGPQPPEPIDLSDREHFRVHAERTADAMFVSKPVMGRVSRQWSVQLTRRIKGSDGGFAGVLVASLDPKHFAEFYRGIDLGDGGAVTLVGVDGVVRASGGAQPDELGSRISDPALVGVLASPAREATTSFTDARTGAMRIASTRQVAGYPLSVLVATNEHQRASSWARNSSIYVVTAAFISVLVLWALTIIIKRGARLSEARRQLYLKSSQLELTLENITQGILMVDGNGEIGFMNLRLTEMLGLPPHITGAGLSYRALIDHLEHSGEFAGSVDPDVLDFIRSPERFDLIPHYERERPNGSVLEVRTKALPAGGFVRTMTDITGRRRAEAKVLQLARHDTLTGLCNRAVFRQHLDEAERMLQDGRSFAVHMIDLDRFKPVNDTYGHLVGDRLLKEVADRLRTAVRAGDIVGRLGGDEFAVLQMGANRQSQAEALASRICHTLCQPYVIDGHTVFIGASVGVALAPLDAANAQELLHAADLALYSAKAGSRGSHAFFRPELHAEHCARRQLEEDLRRAVAEEQFVLHYQPILSLGSNEVTAYEALIRWVHPQRGNIPPLDFIPLAEETGLIGPIGAWVLQTACNDISRRQGNARVAINLSPVQFRDKHLVEMVVDALQTSGLPPERLEIEITESALLQDDELTQHHLDALRELGVHITMDDFGTGYSSLSYLMSYPIQSLKIDRSFVQGLGLQASPTAIVKTITTLATSLGLSTTAEGVETPEQLELLRQLGCTEAQGYYFSKPKPAADILPPPSSGRSPLRVAG